ERVRTAAAIGGLQRVPGREVDGTGVACHVDEAADVYGDAADRGGRPRGVRPVLGIAAAQVGGVEQCRAGGIDLGDEGIDATAVRRLVCIRRREVDRVGGAGYVSIAGGVQGDAVGMVIAA